MKKLGLIINPIAGMGGSVGLKGTDGYEILEQAKKLGAVPQAQNRAITALRQLSSLKNDIAIVTYSGQMGEDAVKSCGFYPSILANVSGRITSSQDTVEAARKMKEEKVDLIMFAGGDGTARDICRVVGERIPVIGIPAGVKIHSAVYASSPAKAGELALQYLKSKVTNIKEAEVMDIDEEYFRNGIVRTRLYGYLRVPYQRKYLQGAKAGSILDENAVKEVIAQRMIDAMVEDILYIIGPGSSTRPIMQKLGLPFTLLGVDLVLNKKLVALDVTEQQLLSYMADRQCKLIITPIGGQGFLFGRGNQQISPAVIRKLGKESIIVIATQQKLHSLHNDWLLTDTGDDELDLALSGYIGVIVGYREKVIFKVNG